MTTPKTSETPTPRTDAVWKKHEHEPWCDAFKAMHEHAEWLERELALAREDLGKSETIFEECRIILIKELNEPTRQAFWKAVEGRDHVKAALENPQKGSRLVRREVLEWVKNDIENRAFENAVTTIDAELQRTAGGEA